MQADKKHNQLKLKMTNLSKHEYESHWYQDCSPWRHKFVQEYRKSLDEREKDIMDIKA